MKITQLLVIYITLFLFNKGFSQEINSRINSILIQQTSDSLPGASITVTKGNEIIFSKQYGIADMSHDIPIAEKTIFNIASVSKQFTVFAILLLEEEGKLSMRDDVRKYFPELKNLKQKITLEQLARHTSGMKNFTSMARMAGWLPRDIVLHKQMLKLVYRQKELNFDPGTDFKYSNTGTLLLAEIVNRISGKTFAEFLKEKVFTPLGMKNTFIRDDETKIIKNLARSYYWRDNYKVLKEGTSPYESYGSTNIYSTTEDLTKWLTNMNNPVVGTKEMFYNMDTQTILNDGTEIRHAMGQFVSKYRNITEIEHTGGHIFVTYLGRFKELDLGIALSSNNSDFDIRGTAHQIANLFIDKTNQTTQPEETVAILTPKIFKLSEKQMNAFNGKYWSDEDKIVRKIFAKNDTLVYYRSENSESYLKPISKNEFQMLGETEELIVSFEKGKMIFDGTTIFRKFEPFRYSVDELQQLAGLYYSKELGQSYELTIENQKLIAKNPKMETIIFKPIMEDRFKSDKWFLNLAEFKRGESKEVKGFFASNYSVINIWFEKVEVD